MKKDIFNNLIDPHTGEKLYLTEVVERDGDEVVSELLTRKSDEKMYEIKNGVPYFCPVSIDDFSEKWEMNAGVKYGHSKEEIKRVTESFMAILGVKNKKELILPETHSKTKFTKKENENVI